MRSSSSARRLRPSRTRSTALEPGSSWLMPTAASFMPMRPATRFWRLMIFCARSAAAALLVRKAALEIPSAPDVIAKAYHLTPTELRVLMAIVEVGGVPEVAVALGIAETTVKTHLSRVFQKTGATRQADLVKLAAGFANPAGR